MGNLKVLIIDDDPIATQVARERIQMLGHTVFVRDSAIGTISWIVASRPDVALIDLNLPEVRGSDLARMLTGRSDLSQISIILFTGATGRELEVAVRDTGAAGVLSKSMSQEVFINEFQRLSLKRAKQLEPDARLETELSTICCVHCGLQSPPASSNFDLIHEHSWRSTKAQAQDDGVFLEWWCPECWESCRRIVRASTIPIV